jgi:anti-sigma factor RsiW
MDETTREDWLDRRLREAAPYIDDNGFTKQVLERLPARRRSRESLRTVILLGITLVASLVAAVAGGGRFVTVEVLRFASLPVLWIMMIALGSGVLVMTGGLVAAVAKTGHDRL